MAVDTPAEEDDTIDSNDSSRDDDSRPEDPLVHFTHNPILCNYYLLA